jgi:ligand-binding sensor domain-containing protein
MTNHYVLQLLFAMLLLPIFGTACNGQNQKLVGNTAEPTANTICLGDTVAEIDGEVRGITQDSKNNLWFATNGNGVFKLGGNTITHFTEKHGLSSNFVSNIQENKEGKIWMEGRGVFSSFDGNEFTTIPVDENAFQTMDYNYLNDELFAGHYYNGKSFVKIQLPHTSPIQNDANIRHHYDIYCTCKDKNGHLWIGTCTAGVCKYDGKTYTWFDDQELGSPVRSIFEDKNGTIWVGNNGDGLFRYGTSDSTSEQKFINFSREKKLHNYDFNKYPIGTTGMMSRIWTITDDKHGNLWIGTIDNGVWMYDGTTVTNYTTKDGLGVDFIWIIFKDNNGDLWFGTEGFGVYVFNPSTTLSMGKKRFEKFTVKK